MASETIIQASKVWDEFLGTSEPAFRAYVMSLPGPNDLPINSPVFRMYVKDAPQSDELRAVRAARMDTVFGAIQQGLTDGDFDALFIRGSYGSLDDPTGIAEVSRRLLFEAYTSGDGPDLSSTPWLTFLNAYAANQTRETMERREHEIFVPFALATKAMQPNQHEAIVADFHTETGIFVVGSDITRGRFIEGAASSFRYTNPTAELFVLQSASQRHLANLEQFTDGAHIVHYGEFDKIDGIIRTMVESKNSGAVLSPLMIFADSVQKSLVENGDAVEKLFNLIDLIQFNQLPVRMVIGIDPESVKKYVDTPKSYIHQILPEVRILYGRTMEHALPESVKGTGIAHTLARMPDYMVYDFSVREFSSGAYWPIVEKN